MISPADIAVFTTTTSGAVGRMRAGEDKALALCALTDARAAVRSHRFAGAIKALDRARAYAGLPKIEA